MAENQPTLNKFRSSLTAGSDYNKVAAPSMAKLTISADGMTTRQAQQRIQKLENLKNEWNVVKAEAEVHQAKNEAHGAMFSAMASEINAGAAFVNAQESYWKYETSVAKETIAHSERDVTVASIPIEQKRHELNFRNLHLQVEQLALESQKLAEDTEHLKIMTQLNGYATNLELPKLEMPKFQLPQFNKDGGLSNAS